MSEYIFLLRYHGNSRRFCFFSGQKTNVRVVRGQSSFWTMFSFSGERHLKTPGQVCHQKWFTEGEATVLMDFGHDTFQTFKAALPLLTLTFHLLSALASAQPSNTTRFSQIMHSSFLLCTYQLFTTCGWGWKEEDLIWGCFTCANSLFGFVSSSATSLALNGWRVLY